MSPRGRVLSGAWIGVLTRFVPPGLVDEALAGTAPAVRAQRVRALPGRVVVYFVLGLCLYSHLSYGQVLREITCGLERRLAAAGWRVPATTTLTAARRRAGPAPLEALFRRVCSALTPAARPWSHVCGLLAVAWDGTTVATAASEANIAAFGQVKGSRGGHFAHQRLVALIACGTRGLIDAAAGPACGKGTGEPALARQLLRSLHEGMLLLADRNFYSYQLWNAAAATRADLLWRVKASLRLQTIQVLDDGSFLARINDPRAVQRRLAKNGSRRRRRSRLPPDTSPLPGGITVRVIQFTLTITTTAGATRTQPVRLITTLTDTQAYPAAELAAAYARRWAIETSYRELKTYLRGPGRTLRAKTPALARQELWACLITYQALRTLICHTAATKDLDPARISFTATLHAARRTLHTPRTRPHATLTHVQDEILTSLVPARPGRITIRAAHPRTPAFPSPRTCKGPRTQHVTCTTTITPPTTTNQPQHPAHQPASPP
jgi:transposase IS4-like protein/DDE family transposase